jgi:hypothetical protein
MQELNKFSGAEVLDQDGFDALTVTNMGDGVVALSQVAEDGTLHNVVLGDEQIAALLAFLGKVVG